VAVIAVEVGRLSAADLLVLADALQAVGVGAGDPPPTSSSITWVGLGIIADNLINMGRWLAQQPA